VETSYPVLLADMPNPRLRVYARETAIAEKFEAMVTLGLGNSRMKDFFDIWYLARTFEFDEATLVTAIRATFARRQTPLPRERPVALTAAFADDPAKAAQWRAFIGRSRAVETAPGLAEVVEVLLALLEPILMGDGHGPASHRAWQPRTGRWM
jgi:predicted nucleotidyltransferase component of viral defense system